MILFDRDVSRLARIGRLAAGARAVAVLMIVSASVVSACVPQPLISLEPRSSGPAGSEVQVNATALSGGRAEVRWNSIEGDVLATGGGSDLSQPITIPQAPPGLYSIIVIVRSPTGAVAATGRAAFLITGEADSSVSTTDGATREREDASAPQSSSNFVSAPVAGLGGAMLLAVGMAGGAVVSRRRRP